MLRASDCPCAVLGLLDVVAHELLEVTSIALDIGELFLAAL